jgi:ABC-type nickel/cobalt efflux system permease component RcnA
LGLSATISHTGVIWILALVGLRYSERLNLDTLEPYFQVGIGLMVIAMAAWMFWRIRSAKHQCGHTHEHVKPGGQRVETGSENHHHQDRALEAIAPEEYEDAHERAHAVEIQQPFANRQATTGQIVLFGLTGGLIPCPAAFTVLLVCLQLKRFALGFALVVAFSLGLAITLMTVGAVAALSVKHVARHFRGPGNVVRNAPYFSASLMVAVGMFVLFQGMRHLLP